MELTFPDKENISFWTQYYPRPEELKNIGIAEELEKRVLKRMKKMFPQLKVFRHWNISHLSDRVPQLKKRGMNEKDIFEQYSFRRGMHLLRKKINRDKLEAQKRRLSGRPR